MPDCEFIHSKEDISEILNFAISIGLKIRLNTPSHEPKKENIYEKDFIYINNGNFFLYRDDWIFGEAKYIKIDDGYNKGKYIQAPRVNESPIVLYFGGERNDGSVMRLGSGVISRHKDWLLMPERVVRETPSDVKVVFDKMSKFIEKGISVKGGRHKYYVMSNAQKKLKSGLFLPPFDYIQFS